MSRAPTPALAEAVQRQLLTCVRPDQGRAEVGTGTDQHQDRPMTDPLHHEMEQLKGHRIDPMHVFVTASTGCRSSEHRLPGSETR